MSSKGRGESLQWTAEPSDRKIEMVDKNKRGKHLRNNKARSRTRVNIRSDQLCSAGENSRSGRPAIGRRGCFVSSRQASNTVSTADVPRALQQLKPAYTGSASFRPLELTLPSLTREVRTTEDAILKLAYLVLRNMRSPNVREKRFRGKKVPGTYISR